MVRLMAVVSFARPGAALCSGSACVRNATSVLAPPDLFAFICCHMLRALASCCRTEQAFGTAPQPLDDSPVRALTQAHARARSFLCAYPR